MAALFAATHLKVKALVALTQSGSTALWMSRANVGVPIFALTPVKETLSKVTLFSGVHPIEFKSGAKDQKQEMLNVEKTLTKLKLVEEGDMVVMTVGEALGKAGHTNTMKIVQIGNCLKK